MTTEVDAGQVLEDGLKQLGISDGERCSRMLQFCRLLLEWNRRTNLTGAYSLHELIVRHVLDSLAPIKVMDFGQPIVDVGSGAGFPGVPLSVVCPHWRVCLVEPRAKRVEFLRAAIRDLELENVSLVQGSALGPRTSELYGGFGTVVMRAVAPPARAIRFGVPFLRSDGTLMLYESNVPPSVATLRSAKRNGLKLAGVRPVAVPHSLARRAMWLFQTGRQRDVSRET